MFRKILALLLAAALLVPAFTVLTYGADTANNADADLWMKTGTERVLDRGTVSVADTEAPTAAPYTEDGRIYYPLRALATYRGYTLGRAGSIFALTSGSDKRMYSLDDTATVNGEKIGPVLRGDVIYIPLAYTAVLFPDMATYAWEEMGLFAVSTGTLDYPETRASLTALNSIARRFVYDYPSAEKIVADVDAFVGLDTHPRLLADQNRFDALRAVWDLTERTPEEAKLYKWMYLCIGDAEWVVGRYFSVAEDGTVRWVSEERKNELRQPYFCYDENGDPVYTLDLNGRVNRSKAVTEYTSPDGTYTSTCEYGDGYDEGGRLNESARYAKYLKNLAFAWQITRSPVYKEAFYLLAVQLGSWVCWGEGHFLNCADAAVEYALGFDWIYHAFDGDTTRRNELAEILYDKAVVKGYYSSTYVSGNGRGGHTWTASLSQYMHVSTTRKSNWYFDSATNNWNTVCTSGISIACLALLEYPAYRQTASQTMSNLLKTMPNCLLAYAPDGSYMESPGYWEYGTRTLFALCAAMESALGDDYGCMDVPGLSRSCYFAYYIGNYNGNTWNYHDGGSGRLDLSSFYYVSRHYGNSDFAYLRDLSLASGASAGIMDILFYDPSLAEGATEPALDYCSKNGIYTAVLRSGWTADAVFTGLHAGPSYCSHGDMDSGNFILEMDGIRWIYDPGSENYNIDNYFNNTYRYFYYRKTLEAHSTLIVRNNSEMPKGQLTTSLTDSFATLSRFYSGEHGALVTADMTPQYGSICTGATRAVMLTDSRRSVVVQDEIHFNTATDLTWLAALNTSVNAQIAEDGRTAYLICGGKRVRVSLLSENEELRFSMVETDRTVLPTTVTSATAEALGKSANVIAKATTPSRRLAIVADGVTDFDVAVVFELFPFSAYSDTPVHYRKVPIAEMTPEDSASFPKSDSEIRDEYYKYKPSDLLSTVRRLRATEDPTLLEIYTTFKRAYAICPYIDPELSASARAFAEFGEAEAAYARQLAVIRAAIEGMNGVMDTTIADFVG